MRGPKQSVVKEWKASAKRSPSACGGPDTIDHLTLASWRRLDKDKQNEVIVKEATEIGIERPKGRVVSFHYNSDAEQHHFGRSHPMKPWRLTLTKQLVIGYGLHFGMDMYQTRPATKAELAAFHSTDYLDFLSRITPDNMHSYRNEQLEFNFGDDCPVFDGMWDYSSIYSGASLDAARSLIHHDSDIAINWSGGLHHAKKKEASGFCYINDIVVAIQQLLVVVPRVLYIDIDVHHGDGVEQAFYSTDRVLTLSFHKYDPHNFFPGTGGMDETGPESADNPGAHHSLNVPLHDGIDDGQYKDIFERITGAVIDMYDPGAIVLQCGADSLGGDRLGKFNLNIKAHGNCVSFVMKKAHNRRLMIVGGGGYTPRNVARTWCHETSLCIGATLHNDLPAHIPYRQAFMGLDRGNGKLYPNLANVPGRRHANGHSKEYLESLVSNALEQLRYIKGAPSVMMQHIPLDYLNLRRHIDEALKDEEEDEACRRGNKMIIRTGPSTSTSSSTGLNVGLGTVATVNTPSVSSHTTVSTSNNKRKVRERNVGGRGELV